MAYCPGVIKRFMSRIETLGLTGAVRLIRDHTERRIGLKRPEGARPSRVAIKGVPNPFFFRRLSSDSLVIDEVFYLGVYKPAVGLKDIRYIVDCGANIGCSSVYFLEKYPDAQLVAIEPDDVNYSYCVKNLEPYSGRAKVLKAGVWGKEVGLVVERAEHPDQDEWGYEVRPARAGERPDVQGVPIVSLLKESPHRQIDLLKVDIEGAERVIFSEGVDEWLPHTRVIVIELHNDECSHAFWSTICRYHYRTEIVVPVTIAFRDLDPSGSAQPGADHLQHTPNAVFPS